MTVRDDRSAGSARVALEAVFVLLAALAYLWLFRTYGFDVVDEGTQLAQIDLVVRGARPYVDFETGYTPLYFLLHAALWRFTGAELLATRTFGVLLHAGTIALLFALARRWFGLRIALCTAAFDLAFLLPVSPRAGAPFNTPYPGWLVALLALLAQLLVAMIAHARLGARGSPGRIRGAIFVAGVAAGLGFAVKPNAGLLALGGALLALTATWPAAQRGAAALAAAVRVAAVAGAVVLLGHAMLAPAYLLGLVLPVVLAALRAAPAGPPGVASPLVDAALLASGFLLPTAAWAAPLLGELGAGRFAREVLLLDGGGVVAAYLIPFPWPGLAATGVCVGVLAAALAAAGTRGRGDGLRAPAGRVLAPLFLAGGVVLAGVLGGSAISARLVAEEVCLWLGPLALAAGLVLIPRTVVTARTHALLAFAAVFALQLFPRPDLIHVAMGAPPLLLAAAATWSWLAAPVVPGAGASRSARRGGLAWATAGAILLLCALRAQPALRVRLAEPMVPLDAGLRAPLVIATPFAAEHRWLGEAVRAIAARTDAGEDVFYFPDLAGLGFLADRPARSFHLYFVPGRPGPEGEERTVAELERRAPRLAVTGAPRVPAFAGADAYFARLVAHLDERYPIVQELSACSIRARAPERGACARDCASAAAG